MGRSRYQFGEAGSPHFMTCTVVGWLPVFTRPETVQILLDSWRFLQDQNRMVLLGYVSDPTHWRYSSARNSAKMESGVWVRTARSFGIEDEDDAERRRRIVSPGTELCVIWPSDLD
jgi:putative transposase